MRQNFSKTYADFKSEMQAIKKLQSFQASVQMTQEFDDVETMASDRQPQITVDQLFFEDVSLATLQTCNQSVLKIKLMDDGKVKLRLKPALQYFELSYESDVPIQNLLDKLRAVMLCLHILIELSQRQSHDKRELTKLAQK